MSLLDTIDRMIKRNKPLPLIVGKVTAFDEETYTCTVVSEGVPEFTEVRCQSIIGKADQGVLLRPTINSYVLIAFIDDNAISPAIISTEKIDSLKFIVEDMELGGNEFGGLVKVDPLTKKINALEKDLNALKTVFKSYATVPQTGSADLKVAAAAWANSSITATVKTDLENEKIKHG